MAAKTTTSSCHKEAPFLLTQIRKRLAPSFLYAFIGLFHNAVKAVYMFPLTSEMSRHLTEMEHTDPSSAEFAGLLEETQRKAWEVLIISITVALVTLTLAFSKHFVARCFAASSTTTYSSSGGDRYSLAELLREVTKWHHLRSSLVTIGAVLTVASMMSQLASVALLRGNFATGMRDPGLLFLAAFLAFVCIGVVALMSVAAKRKEWAALVLVTLLLPTLLIPLCEVALLYFYATQIPVLGLSMVFVYDLLQGVQDVLYFSAASVYYQWQF